MEAIREYLHNMFLNLPETPQVLRAKAELMEMMEDKYEELRQEGMSEDIYSKKSVTGKTERGLRWRIIRMTMRRHFCGI